MNIKKYIKKAKDFNKKLELRLERFYYIKLYNKSHKQFSQYKLNKQQIAEIDAIYKKHLRINYYSHAFYADKTGLFSPYYVPDGLYYAYIDHYFNDWKKGKIMDNKCEYYKMFPGIPQPVTVCYRENGIWFDNQNRPCGITPPL